MTPPEDEGVPRMRRFSTLALIGVLACWCIYPLVADVSHVHDGIPMVTAGRLLPDRIEDVYPVDGRISQMTDAFLRAGCDDTTINPTCGPTSAFVSPPLAFPVVMATAAAPGDVGMRLWVALTPWTVALSLFLLRRRPLFARQPWLLLAASVALTPAVLITASVGQSTGLLVLALVAGSFADRRTQVIGGVALALAVSLKLSPLVMVVVAVMCARRVLAATAAVGVVVAAAVATAMTPDGWSRFFELSAALADAAPRTAGNGSWSALFGSGVGAGLLLVFAAVTTSAIALRRDRAMGWLVCWIAVLLLTPFVWWHYLLLPAFALLVAAAHEDRPALAWIGVGIAALMSTVELHVWSADAPHALVLLATVVVLLTTMLRPSASPRTSDSA